MTSSLGPAFRSPPHENSRKMQLVRKVRSFISIPFTTKWLFVKALLISMGVRFTLSFLPFRRVLAWLGKPNVNTPDTPDETHRRYRKQVRDAVDLCNRYSFWKTECYTQSLTAKLLLRQKNIESTLYIGLRKNEMGKYEGHAWLRSADMIVTGGKEKNGFEVHSFFS